MPKKGAAPAPPPEPETQTVEATVDKDGGVTATNKTTGKVATARGGAKTTAREKVDLSGSLADEDDIVSVTYWGPYGSGKTVDLLSMAKLDAPGRVLLINSEAGAKPRSLVQHGIDPDRIVPWPPRGHEVTYEGLEQLFYTVAGEMQADPSSWLGGAWDSVTSIEAFLLEQAVAQDVAAKNEILRAANKDRSGNITARDEFLPETDDYIRMQTQFRSLFRKFRYLNWHFGMTALVRRDEDRKTKRVTYGPAVSPKLQNEVGGGPDIVIRTFAIETPDGPVWYGRTFPTVDEPAKDRFGALPRELVNPTFDRIVAYVKGELLEADDPDQKLLPGNEPKSGKRTPAARKPAISREATQQTPADATSQEQQRVQDAIETKTAPPARPKRTPTRRPASKPAPSELGSADNPPF